MNPRFTIDGSDTLERHLAATCEKVREGVASLVPAGKLDGLLLAGGYGRGEGGVLRSPQGDEPYNDLEFYVFVRGNALLAERAYRGPLHALGEALSPAAGLEVEFKVLTLGKLRRSSPSMFYYDLVAAHRWVIGEDALLAGCEHHRDPAAIPLHEATRLLFNRCSGLLFSFEQLGRECFGAREADFVGRNLAKAQLAFGDALLAARGEYHWSCRERHRRLLTCADLQDGLGWAGPLKGFHARGVEFKLHPQRSTESREILAARHAELADVGLQLWLWLESRRLGVGIRSAREYALSPVDKCPETSRLRNWLLNLRTLGPAGLANGRYPRERLLHALALLLWDAKALADSQLLGRVSGQLRSSARDLPGLVAAYLDLWKRFN